MAWYTWPLRFLKPPFSMVATELERLLVEVIPIHLVFEQLPAELGGAAVGLLVAHPDAVAGMVQTHLRRRASDGHQVAGPVGVPRQHRRLRRHAGGWRVATLGSPPGPRRIGTRICSALTPLTS